MKRIVIPMAILASLPSAVAIADCPIRNTTTNNLKMSKPADGYDKQGDAITSFQIAPGAAASIPEGQEWAFLMQGNYTSRTCSGGTAYTVTWEGGLMKISP